MTDDALDDVFANVLVLIREEQDVRHRLGGHAVPVPQCPLCRLRTGWHASAEVAALHDS